VNGKGWGGIALSLTLSPTSCIQLGEGNKKKKKKKKKKNNSLQDGDGCEGIITGC